ncbi:MAG: hypothetical protein AVDCRST_MAG13-511, partial [uncultured Solirubrobacteraceae bacterium]
GPPARALRPSRSRARDAPGGGGRPAAHGRLRGGDGDARDHRGRHGRRRAVRHGQRLPPPGGQARPGRGGGRLPAVPVAPRALRRAHGRHGPRAAGQDLRLPALLRRHPGVGEHARAPARLPRAPAGRLDRARRV